MANTRDFQSFKSAATRSGSLITPDGSPVQTLPPPGVRDTFGRELQAGDFVLVRTPNDPPFQIQAITVLPPDPARGIPEGLMRVEVYCQQTFLAQRQRHDPTFLRVLTREEYDQLTQSAPPPPEPVE